MVFGRFSMARHLSSCISGASCDERTRRSFMVACVTMAETNERKKENASGEKVLPTQGPEPQNLVAMGTHLGVFLHVIDMHHCCLLRVVARVLLPEHT